MGLTLMQKIDVLDGNLDGKFGGKKLNGQDFIIAACKRARWKSSIKTWLRLPTGTQHRVAVDCKQQWRKLKTLTDIAGKMPLQRMFIASANKKTLSIKLTQDDKTGHVIVYSLVTSLLLATNKPSDSFAKIFYDVFSNRLVGMMLKKYLGNKTKTNKPKDNVKAAYEVLKRLGKKYSFSTTAFKPSSRKK